VAKPSSSGSRIETNSASSLLFSGGIANALFFCFVSYLVTAVKGLSNAFSSGRKGGRRKERGKGTNGVGRGEE
jgi:hypothetical protein